MQLNENAIIAIIKERENMRRNKRERKKQKVIQINVGFTILKVIAIIIIISLITAQTVRTIIQARTSTSESETEAETTEEEATYYLVDSTEIDEETGEYIQVPVPVGYTASQIEGETGVSTGFVIYEGDIDWSEIIVDEATSTVVETTVSQSEAETTVDANTDKDEQTEGEASNENASKDLAADDTTNSTSDGATSENSEEDEATNSASEISENTTENGTSIISDEEVATYTVTVYYLDEDTLEEIADTVTTTYDEGDTYETEQLEIEGYTYSSVEGETEGTVTGDITVIYYYTEEKTYYLSEYYSEETASNIWDLQCSTNQWVWVSVTEEEIENIYGVDENGKYWGKLYSDYDTPLNWTETDGVMSITSATGYREPDVKANLTEYDIDSTLTRYLNGITRNELLVEFEENFYETIESIRKYGGFYIGRYETGNLSNSTATVIKNNSDTASKTWYVMYEKCKELAGENSNVTTSMIWGSLWDATLRWLYEIEATSTTGATLTLEELHLDGTWAISYSSGWGNHTNVSFEYYTAYNICSEKEYGTITILNTGCTEYTKINNIYDLAGNIWEYTIESYSDDCIIARGGANTYYGTWYSAMGAYGYTPDFSHTAIRL